MIPAFDPPDKCSNGCDGGFVMSAPPRPSSSGSSHRLGLRTLTIASGATQAAAQMASMNGDNGDIGSYIPNFIWTILWPVLFMAAVVVAITLVGAEVNSPRAWAIMLARGLDRFSDMIRPAEEQHNPNEDGGHRAPADADEPEKECKGAQNGQDVLMVKIQGDLRGKVISHKAQQVLQVIGGGPPGGPEDVCGANVCASRTLGAGSE